ncbi:MAG: aminoglycoside phosphotransferase family protein [Rhodobacteraceae bacterium]|nr:aminoglycoside phosphotransferase family protein [Paracoccaceae bacterium]
MPPCLLAWARRNLGGVDATAGWTALTGGRTNRVWRVRWPDADLVVKLYARGMASRLFPNSPASEARALQGLAGTGLAPVLYARGTTDAGPVLCYRMVEGQAPAGPEGAAAVARTLAALHARPAPDRFRRVSVRPRALSRGILSDLAGVPSGPAVARLTSLAARVPTDAPPPGPTVLLHGDPAAGNALVTRPDAITLIDWQCPAIGDPLHDLAIALSPGMRALYDCGPLTGAERLAFWHAYGNDETRQRHRALAALLSARIAAHFLAQAARGRAGYAAAADAELAALEE